MIELLWLIPAFPLAGFLVLVLGGDRFPLNGIATVGVGSVGASAILAVLVALEFFRGSIPGNSYSQTLWTWVSVAGFTPSFAFYLDALSLLMVLVVTVVGFMIHFYSAEYMIDDDGYRRFFAYMNLFVAAMLTLVLADNLVLLYLGWEGVGLCSFLLIGFWYKETENVNAAVKAFVMTRIGDTAMLLGLFLLFHSFGTLQIQEILQRAPHEWTAGSQLAMLAAALLLGGALGKSAQLPLQTWLPDAMAGPTPVSALIHAATMVTAGVYLIARTNVLFTLAPAVQFAVAVIGTVTLLMAGFAALTQTDIKRVLAYSTISQIGYMFLALGVGAWSAAMFHFLTHACFKSLLFLGAGAVILSAGHEQNMFKLGGLRKQLPVTFWTFMAGAASLAALPLVTDGFYSKDLILWCAWSCEKGGPWLWAGGAAGALLTGLYTFRMVFLTFFGEAKTRVAHRTGAAIHAPLIVLAVLSVAVGFMELPPSLGDVRIFSNFIEKALPSPVMRSVDHGLEPILMIVSSVLCLLGVLVAYFAYIRRPDFPRTLCQSPLIDGLRRFWLAGWGFDRLYDCLFVKPFIWLARINRKDFVDLLPFLISEWASAMHEALALAQTGKVRHYAMGIAIGAIVALGIVVLL
jgi:NADH-quinone oxidoreductase subunit L